MIALVGVGCSVKTDEYSSSGDSTDAPSDASDDSTDPTGDGDDSAGSEEALGDKNPDELAFVDSDRESGAVSDDAGTGNTTSPDGDYVAETGLDDVGGASGSDDDVDAASSQDSSAAAQGADPDGSSAAQNTAAGYGSASLDSQTPAAGATPTPAAGLLGPSSTGSADSTGVGPEQLAENATRGAILMEAFAVPGARLLSDADRRCVIAEFEAVSGSNRADQIIASLAAEATDVDVLVNGLVVCDALAHISTGLIEELDPLLEDRIADQVAECLGETYGEPQELAAAMKLGLTEPEDTTDAGRQGAFAAVLSCVGLGDIVAADTIGLSDEARVCLNQIGTEIMDTLLNVEIRGSQANLDSVQIEALFATCLSPTELEATSD